MHVHERVLAGKLAGIRSVEPAHVVAVHHGDHLVHAENLAAVRMTGELKRKIRRRPIAREEFRLMRHQNAKDIGALRRAIESLGSVRKLASESRRHRITDARQNKLCARDIEHHMFVSEHSDAFLGKNGLPAFIFTVLLVVAVAAVNPHFGLKSAERLNIFKPTLDAPVNQVARNEDELRLERIHPLNKRLRPASRQKRRKVRVGKLNEFEAFERLGQIRHIGRAAAHFGHLDAARERHAAQSCACSCKTERSAAILLHGAVRALAASAGEHCQKDNGFAKEDESREEKQKRLKRFLDDYHAVRKLGRNKTAEKEGRQRGKCGNRNE
mgnify:CR=1 FL=1